MKKSITFMLCTFLFCACNNDTLTEFNSSQNESANKENSSMLHFNSEKDYQQAIESLASLENKGQKDQWLKSKYGKFTSLKAVYDSAMIDAAKLDESKEAFVQYKDKYKKSLYFANYKDDCGAYLPVTNTDAAYLLNADGNVSIAGKVINKRDVDSYAKLQQAGVAMYDNKFLALTRGGWSYNILHHSTTAFQDKSNNVGEEFDSGWWKQNKRKVRLKCGRKVLKGYSLQGYTFVMKMHLEVSFRKKTWLGWANYSSVTETVGEFEGGLNDVDTYRESGWSSHDFYKEVSVEPFVENGRIFWYNAPIKGKLTVNYQGIGLLPSVEFTIGGVSALMPPPTIMPRR